MSGAGLRRPSTAAPTLQHRVAALVAVARHVDRALLSGALLALLATFLHPAATLNRPLVDHVVVFDITQSMGVQDVQLAGRPTSRLLYAKSAFRDALLRLPCGSKVGWGVFTEYRSLLLFSPVEVCANLTELRATLEHIDGRMAWTGNSEIAKGLYSAIDVTGKVPGKPSLVFVTDGQEAPPVSPLHRPVFHGNVGDVAGLLVGVGDLKPSPIPKVDPEGRPLGFWRADEVAQADTGSRRQGSSVANEAMTEEPGGKGATALPGAAAGSEHLSSLREGYLRLIAGETGLGFLRLQSVDALVASLTAPGLTRGVPARADLRPLFGALAGALLLLRYRQRLRSVSAALTRIAGRHRET